MATWSAGWEQLKVGQQRAVFYRAWEVACRTGFSHARAMEMMGPQPPDVEGARHAVLAMTSAGRTLADTMRAAPTHFSGFEAGLLESGEAGGTLEPSLRLLAAHWTSQHLLMLWVMKQMAYPMMTSFAACFIVPFPLLFFGHPVAYLASALGAATLLYLNGGALVAQIAAGYANRPALVLARLARALALAVQSGLGLDRVTSLAAAASGSEGIIAHIEAQAPRVRLTQTIAQTLAGAPGLSRDVEAMLAVADRTGDYATSLGKLADLLEDGFR